MEALLNNLTKSIGWSIIHSLWQGAIIYAILFIVLTALPKMSAKFKHNLSFGSLLLIFISFTITFLSIFEFPSTTISNIDTHQITYQDFIQFKISSTFKTETYLPVVVSIYILGLSIQLFVLISSYFKLKNLKRLSTLAVPTEWKEIFNLTLSQLKINKTVKFYLSPKVNVPLVIGFIKPVVLFPIALATQLDAKQVEAILIHELSHIRRNDYLINLVKTCVETLLFFNPFVWLTTKFIQIEREHACDDLVVDITGTPLTYAHTLLKLELLKNKQTPALSLAATGKNQHLYQRIKRITNMKTNYMNTKHIFFMLSLTIATVISLAWINPEKKAVLTIKKEISLAQIKSPATEAKSIQNRLIVKADTDTVKKKFKSIYVTHKNGKKVIYNSIEEMPDSLKTKILEIEKKYNSPEWKDKMAKIELNAKELEKKYNSPEWKDKMAKIEFNAKELEKKYNSPEWKDKMAKIEFNAKELEKKYNSPEWKDKIAKIEFNAKELEKKYNSPEWKKKVQEMEKLQESSEYKELRKKYESDLDELKKAKGIKDDSAFLLLKESNLNSLFSSFSGNFKNVFTASMPLEFKATNLKLDELKSLLEKSPSKKLNLNNTMELKLNQ